MKAIETVSAVQSQTGTVKVHGDYTYTKVRDGRKQPIRGLWARNGRFYAQITVEDPNTGAKDVRRVPLMDKDGHAVQSASQAKAEYDRLKVRRTDNNLPSLRRTPRFCEYVPTYLEFIKSGQDTEAGQASKKDSTIQKEESTLGMWVESIGALRLDQIKRQHIETFKAKRLTEGKSKRTVNLDVICLRNILKKAVDDGHLQSLPTVNMRPLKVSTPQRSLFTHADLEKICEAAKGTKTNTKGEVVPLTKNAEQFTDYIRLLAFSGARRNEALALRWDDVDFTAEKLTIGADGDTKNQQARRVNFNPKLKAHLQDMAKRRAPDTQWLFPSPQRGAKDIHVKTFKESLELARTAAGMPGIGFHDFRHYFISYAVMSGIDYMTIAKWVGHQDGGVLIGKVYGHLADEHVKEQAKLLTFEPVVLTKQEVA